MKVLYAFFAMLGLCTNAQPTGGPLGDFVWNDLNGNGLQDPGEPGIPNVTVTLFDASGTVIATTTTNASGSYQFTNLAARDYQIGFTLPSGYSFSPANAGSNDAIDSDADPLTGRTPSISLSAGSANLSLDAGIAQTTGQLGDFVWDDLNGNGLQEASEPGISGVTVTLFGASGLTRLASTTTDASGSYRFTNLAPGVYQIEFTLPFGYSFSLANAGSDTMDSDVTDPTTGRTPSITLSAGVTDNTIDAGMYVQPRSPQPSAAPSPAPTEEPCPCEDDWKNHGQYVQCVVRDAKERVELGSITPEEMRAITKEAAQSDCGKKDRY